MQANLGARAGPSVDEATSRVLDVRAALIDELDEDAARVACAALHRGHACSTCCC